MLAFIREMRRERLCMAMFISLFTGIRMGNFLLWIGQILMNRSSVLKSIRISNEYRCLMILEKNRVGSSAVCKISCWQSFWSRS